MYAFVLSNFGKVVNVLIYKINKFQTRDYLERDFSEV